MPDHIAIHITFLIYLSALLGLGVLAWQHTHNLPDYILGGRRMGSTVTALSAGASDMSGWLLLGLPAYAFVSGASAGWLALGLLLGSTLNWILVAKPLRLRTAALGDALTLPDFFEAHFEDRSRLLRLVSALMILVFFVLYTASGLVAGGKLFNTVFGWSYETAVIVGTVAVVLYTFLGGFLAVSWTDALQALLMLLALAVVAVLGVEGLDLSQIDAQRLNPMIDGGGNPMSWVSIVSLMAWGLGYFGQPHILARFMAIADPQKLGRARNIAITWTLLSLALAMTVGFTAWGHLDGNVVQDAEKVFMLMIEILLHPVVAGIALSAILAAIMSTADSQLLVAASAVSEDFYRQLINNRASPEHTMWIGRLAVILVAILALIMALDRTSQVLDLVAYAWAGFGAAFGPVILMILYWKPLTRNGALAGILSGGATVVLWRQMEGPVFEIYEMVPGVLMAAFMALFVSLLDRMGEPPQPEAAQDTATSGTAD